jgi:hypothetical protein
VYFLVITIACRPVPGRIGYTLGMVWGEVFAMMYIKMYNPGLIPCNVGYGVYKRESFKPNGARQDSS